MTLMAMIRGGCGALPSNLLLAVAAGSAAAPADDKLETTTTQVNNLTSALRAKGVHGFVYNSSAAEQDESGHYNWCNMPHVRPREYIRAHPDFDLQYVEVIHRHHKRTPYASNAFPVESHHWDCDDVHLHLYGQPLQGNAAAAPVFQQGYTSTTNPFVPSGWIGSCKFPQITAGGLDDSWQHGADLYAVYHHLLGFLPARNADYKSAVTYRVTNNEITSQVAAMVINGMWSTTDPFPLLVQAPRVDSLEPQYACEAADSLFAAIKSRSNPEWEQHLDLSGGLFRKLDDISSVPSNDEAFHASFDHYYDNLSARQCHAISLPCKLPHGGNNTICVSQEAANAVYRMGHWEYSQIYRDHPSSLPASVAAFGVWISELTSHLRDVMSGKSRTIYFHNVAHDGSVSRLLSILQIDEMTWPGLGAEVVFELYQQKAPMPNSGPTGYYIRVLYGGKVFKSSQPILGRLDMLPVEVLLDYLDGLVGKEASLIKTKCRR
ncbi:hypothetical protein UVI_02027540 [Ustilaginoidea virens]|uniref:Histidine acid phosphatase family protein n=1 Tax=Ustilaginoidea virens TaxID=1159556 RepID=A0A1B5KVI9_USTVR|nr:hypothetical protein UVI_02027540 [Ustilaginoidea virens]